MTLTEDELIAKVQEYYVSEKGDWEAIQERLFKNPDKQQDNSLCNEFATATAARFGFMRLLEHVRSYEVPCPWDVDCCIWAAQNERLDMLQWLRSQKPPCPWDDTVCEFAAACKSVVILKWLRQHDESIYGRPCPWTYLTLIVAVESENMDMIRFCVENGCEISNHLCVEAAYRGNLEILKYLYHIRAPFGVNDHKPIHESCKEFMIRYANAWISGDFHDIGDEEVNKVDN